VRKSTLITTTAAITALTLAYVVSQGARSTVSTVSAVSTSSDVSETTSREANSANTTAQDVHDLHSVQIPDFASIRDVRTKKQTFFNYFEPIIEAENDRILSLREEIQQGLPEAQITELCARYRVNTCTEESLLHKVDVIPLSMVLAQAAVESAWGTSRFARQANNYFGQWCFSEGCGIVPRHRSAGAKHEVQIFDSPKDAVAAYFLNINSHPAYEPAREIRASAYERNNFVAGSDMVGGLLSYSGIGEHYIDELRSIIRVNHLEEPRTVAQNSGGH